MRFSTGFPALAALILGACSGPAQTACAGDGVTASDAWIRASHPGQKMGAAYVQLCNGGKTPDRLVAVFFDGAGAVELHASTVDENGVAAMAPLEGGLELAPRKSVTMEPGGAHIMLIGLSAALAEGDKQVMTLQFENTQPLTIPFEVRAADQETHGGH